ncbi:hypothetical protein SORBI_3007G110800 [Sorghum bicolor]|uniref:MATH domain-containing protein n=2 Tax=Sorghum bicolor TaxID=4558 RepID=C5YKC8_SORBI|nr:hypothetical protein SORBI_3007G110800 [Sorghum bicolor]
MTTTAAEVTVSTAVATAAATKCHMFKIEGYKRIKAMYGTGKSIDSCRFEAAGRTWRIHFYPDGDNRENAGHASLFLKLDDDDDDDDAGGNGKRDDKVLVEFKFSLVCHRNGGWPVAAGDQPQSGTLTATFFSNKQGNSKALGYSQFMKRRDLEQSRFLRDDCLAIRCDMAVLDSPVDVKEQAAQAHDLQRLGVACDCKDDACKSYHLRNSSFAFKLREALLKLFLGCFHV